MHLDEIIDAVTSGHPDGRVEEFFHVPLHEVSTVEHRQQIFRDLERDHIRQPILNFVDSMRTMRHRLHQASHLSHPLQRQGWFIHAVETFCDTVTLLRDELVGAEPTSRGLCDFTDYVAAYVDSETFRSLVTDTEAVRTGLHNVRYTVHIEGLRVHVEKYQGQTDYSEGVVATFDRFATEVREDYHVALRDDADMNPVEERILDCVAELYPEAFAQLEDFCQRNGRFARSGIVQFDQEIRFYLQYLEFISRFSNAGVAFSYPEVTTEPGTMTAEEAFDLALAIKSSDESLPLVGNSFSLSDPERIFVVTGPNQGGKTTFARTVGQCAYLASLGCPIPARSGRFTVPDEIYTHFERKEALSSLHGKLEEELVRIHDILSRATATSVIIMNESLSSTTVSDALLISTEILERIVKLRCVAVCVTFLDELASADRTCVSMVGEVARDDPTRRTFTFTRRPADGLAYAAALADKHGLSHDALRQRISR